MGRAVIHGGLAPAADRTDWTPVLRRRSRAPGPSPTRLLATRHWSTRPLADLEADHSPQAAGAGSSALAAGAPGLPARHSATASAPSPTTVAASPTKAPTTGISASPRMMPQPANS